MSVTLSEDFVVAGDELSLDEAEALKDTGKTMIADAEGPIRVDLGDLERANSVTVAVLIAWYRAAALEDKQVILVNPSQELREIIEFSGLGKVLLPAMPGL